MKEHWEYGLGTIVCKGMVDGDGDQGIQVKCELMVLKPLCNPYSNFG